MSIRTNITYRVDVLIDDPEAVSTTMEYADAVEFACRGCIEKGTIESASSSFVEFAEFHEFDEARRCEDALNAIAEKIRKGEPL